MRSEAGNENAVRMICQSFLFQSKERREILGPRLGPRLGLVLRSARSRWPRIAIATRGSYMDDKILVSKATLMLRWWESET